MGLRLLSDVWTQGLSLMLRLSTMMGGIGKAHTIRQALLHAPKVQTELSLFLPPISSVSLPKGEVQHSGKTFVMSLFGKFSKLENKISNG